MGSGYQYDYLVAGSGFAGAVLAERLASQLGKRCLVVDRRTHLGGNAHDSTNDVGVLVHRYGPHYFRSNSAEVVDHLSQFTEWRPVDYKALSWTDQCYWQFPINLNTFEQLLGRPSSSEEMQATLNQWRVAIAKPRNSEEQIVSQVGWGLYNKFFRNYTRKQWGRDPSELDPSISGRIPIRTDRNDRYLSEKFQALPAEGYTRMFEKMLRHPAIDIVLGRDYRDVAAEVSYEKLIYTGPIDAYYQYCFGELPYRSLRFEHQTTRTDFVLPEMQINYPNDFAFTRAVEIKRATGQRIPYTTVVREYPEEYARGKERYYPVPCPASRSIYKRYAMLAKAENNVHFVGRLARYRYYNMDQVVAMSLREFDRIAGIRRKNSNTERKRPLPV